MRQYFYLVVAEYDEYTYPQKIFLQEHAAIKWGRKQATESLKYGYIGYEYVLFKQEITGTGLKRVKTLEPYSEFKGSDFDVEKQLDLIRRQLKS